MTKEQAQILQNAVTLIAKVLHEIEDKANDPEVCIGVDDENTCEELQDLIDKIDELTA